MGKLKWIKKDEIVVKKRHWDDYESYLADMHRLSNSVLDYTANYWIRTLQNGSCLVYVDNLDREFPIKLFDSDDPEYNRICAEELVELLNQEQ